MTKRMLIDATHAEETRVVVLDGNRLEDFDVETAAKKQLKGNIYLAKVVRVEPSLQAAFVEYGGGRHGFLAFGEIHPDYYQIPVADRQRLLEMQEAEARAEEEAEDAAAAAEEAAESAAPALDTNVASEELDHRPDEGGEPPASELSAEPPLPMEEDAGSAVEPAALAAAVAQDFIVAREEAVHEEPTAPAADDLHHFEPAAEAAQPIGHAATPAEPNVGADQADERVETAEIAETAADEAPQPEPITATLESGSTDQADERATDDDVEEVGGSERPQSRPPARYMRSYKIQEVIRRRQILLIQVVKEERGTKGAALTTFISLAGRFSVLMPNSPRGGGISRKITSATDRRRLKEVTAELQIPRGMGLIVRTAGAARPKAEIKRDCEYLLELWDSIRETTMASIAPTLIHEEASLIKRSIRDNYSRDVDEVVVDGEAGWRAARDFMRMLMPAHARKVVMWNEPQPLFAKNNVEAQLDAMLEPTVQLRSGGYLVINQTEALVAIDVNSGRSTRERGIEETALKTNLEAADEVARQLRLRDLAGLIVIDFIDMESRRNNASVEKRIKDALRDDRARIQLGSISHFGLLELSRQRLRPSLAETSFTVCPHCAGTGHVRTTETAALAVLRTVEEEGAKRRSAAIVVHVAGAVALYILNNKRVRLAEIERRYGMSVSFAADESLLPPLTRIERVRAMEADALYVPPPMPALAATPEEDDLAEEEADSADDEDENAETESDAAGEATADVAVAGETAEEADTRRRKRRRRRRGGRREDGTGLPAVDPANLEQPDIAPLAADTAATENEAAVGDGEPVSPTAVDGVSADGAGEDDGRGRRRGRRGGRRRRREPGEAEPTVNDPVEGGEPASSFDAAPSAAYTYTGPTPADPFGGQAFDIFDIMDEPEAPIVAAKPPPVAPEPPPVTPHTPPEREGEAAEATVPAELPPEPEAVTVKPALIEDEPPLLNGHALVPAPVEAEPVSAPVSSPTLVGEVPVTEKKRGWWHR